MKKILFGMILGFLLSIPVGVSAEVISLVGSKVSGLIPVYINDKKINNDAIIVNELSYLPIRSLANELDLELQFIDSKILLTTKGSNEDMEMILNPQEENRDKRSIEIRLRSANLRLNNEKAHLNQLNNALKNLKDNDHLTENEYNNFKLNIETQIQETETKVSVLEKEIKELEDQLTQFENSLQQ